MAGINIFSCNHYLVTFLFAFIFLLSITDSWPNGKQEENTEDDHSKKVDGREREDSVSYVYMDTSSKEPSKEWINWKVHIDFDSTIQLKNHLHAKFAVKQSNQNHAVHSVCLATQLTMNWLYHLVEVARNWRGPMSVAINVPGTEFTQAKILLWLLYRCTDIASSEIVFRLTFPFDDPPIDYPGLWKGIDSSRCNDIPAVMEELDLVKEYLRYPQNMMRNIARESCNTTYVMTADNDMIPTPNLARDLEPVLKQQMKCFKCAFVIPVYEFSDEVTRLPENKTQLLSLVKKNLAQPFHWVSWNPNQASHRPKYWETLPETKKLRVAYPVGKQALGYEPIYVTKKGAPRFQERFKGYGYTRSSQVFHMLVQGYRLFVLDPVFLSHRGMKKPGSNPQWRLDETHRNFDTFIDFAIGILKGKGIDKALSYLNDTHYPYKIQLMSNIVSSIDNFRRYKNKA